MDYEYKIFIVSKKIQYPVLQISSQFFHMARYMCTKACEQHNYQQIFIFIIALHMHVHMLLAHNLQYHSSTYVLSHKLMQV